MRSRSRPLALGAAVLLAAALAAAGAIRSCVPLGPAAGGAEGERGEPHDAGGAAAVAGEEPRGEVPLPSASPGWEEAAETVSIDLRRLLLGRPAAGAFEEARADAARQDLALFPPDPTELRRMLLASDTRARTLALVALAARPQPSDDLVRIVLRSQRSEDEEVVRLLGAEVVSALPPELLARHEDDLLRAFAREQNPFVLAVALPALERMEEPRLRALLDAQLALAAPEMLPVLVGLARDRLGPDGVRSLGVLVRETSLSP